MDTQALELSGRRSPLRPVDGQSMAECDQCGDRPTCMIVWTRSRVVSRLVARVTGEHLSRYTAVLRSCGHAIGIEEGDLAKKIKLLFNGGFEADTHCRACGHAFVLSGDQPKDATWQQDDIPFCARCVSHCHDSEIADHFCMIDRWKIQEGSR